MSVENITCEILEIQPVVQPDEPGDAMNWLSYFEENIPEDAMVIKVKFNKIEDDGDGCHLSIKHFIEQYMKCKIYFASAGIHRNGQSKVPHIHYHFITSKYKMPSNSPQDRKRWIAKDPDMNYIADNCTMQFCNIDLSEPKYHVLAYPLKEGILVPDKFKGTYIDYKNPNERMKRGEINFLKSVGNDIYQKALAAADRRDRHEERKKNKLQEIYELCAANKVHFHSLRSMMQWLDENYIKKLELHELPDFRNYRSNCEKVAVNLGIIKYSELL